MNELRLNAVSCPQCGAPGIVREGTRITECERCGARLCLTEVSGPRYEAVAQLSATQALSKARSRIHRGRVQGQLGRPEMVLIPYHEIAGRRVGVFDRKVPERERVHRTIHSSSSGGPDVESKFVYREREDVKVMISDVQHLSPAARPAWDLSMFDAESARRGTELVRFELVEAQRRATVYAEEETPLGTASRRFADAGSARMVAASRRTIFFPFWLVPVEVSGRSYQMVVDGVAGRVVAWRLPRAPRREALWWGALVVPGALGIGQGLHGLITGSALVSPIVAMTIGIAATAVALHRVDRPDLSVETWPSPASIPRLERDEG